MSEKVKVIVALDFAEAAIALKFVDMLSPEQCAVKVGSELFTRAGPELVRQLVALDFKVFLDLKFYDIPNTVAQSCLAAAELGVWMLNVHALGGLTMMIAARTALQRFGTNAPLLIAVTALTSYSDADWSMLGFEEPIEKSVLQLAHLAQQAGLDGVVCSAQEATILRQHFGENFCLVTPGIRLETDALDDQQRVMTPAQAFSAGSDYLVMGRSITRAADPVAILKEINAS